MNLIFNLKSGSYTTGWTGTHFFFSAASKLVRLLDDSLATMVFHNIVLDISSEMFISGCVVTVILSTGMLMMLPLMRGTCTVPELSNTWDPWCAWWKVIYSQYTLIFNIHSNKTMWYMQRKVVSTKTWMKASYQQICMFNSVIHKKKQKSDNVKTRGPWVTSLTWENSSNQ